jgi:hypothetical protein
MASPPEVSRGTWRLAAIASGVALLALGAGCDKKKDAPQPGANPATPAAATAETTAAKPGALRCEDFLSKAEAQALGLKAERYSEMASAQMAGVHCTFGEVSAQIWRGEQYTSIINGLEANGARTGVALEDGPKVGAETQWTTMPDVHGMDGKAPHVLNFVPANKKFTAAVTGTDKAKIEQVAKALLAKFETL